MKKQSTTAVLRQRPPGDLQQQLLCHTWLGNVRELRSTAKRFVLGLSPISTTLGGSSPKKTSLKSRLQQIEKALIEESLSRNERCVDSVAVELNIAKRTLYYKMKQLAISLALDSPPHESE